MNMKPIKILLAVIAGQALILTALSAAVPAAETARSLIIPNDFSAGKTKTRDSSIAIPVDAVLYKLKQKQKITLIDVRSRQDFERLHIPGSINIPLYAVKTKFFLKPFPIVLVNEGFQYSPLESECRQLTNLGFNAFILDGGLPAWKRKGGRLAGDLFALEEIQTLAPQVLWREKNYETNLMIDISPVQSEASRKLMPYSKHLPVFADPGEWVRKLGRIITSHKSRPFLSVLLFNETGDGYGELDKILAGISVNTFFLQGGIAGYQQYLEDLTLSWRPRDRRIRTNKTCRTCSEEIEGNIFTNVRE